MTGTEAMRAKLRQPWTVLAVVAVLAAAVVQVIVAWSAVAPAFPFDEIVMLQMSRMIAGVWVPVVSGTGYFPAWSILMAPIWWVTSDPLTAYRLAVWLGVAIGMVTIWPLAALIRQFGTDGRRVTKAQAVAIAATIMVLPSRAIQSDYLLSERVLFVFVVLTALAAFRFAARPSVLRGVLFGLCGALMLLAHVRVIPVLMATVVWLLMMMFKHRREALAALGSLLFFGAIAYVTGRTLNTMLLGSFTQGDTLMNTISNLQVGMLVRAASGQLWYQLVASFGLIGLGVAVVAVRTRGEFKAREFGGYTYLVGTTTAAAIVSVLQWSSTFFLFDSPWVRLDAWVYGRYVDPFAALIIGVAFAAILARASVWNHVFGALASGALMVLVVGWTAKLAATWGFVTPSHIPGILPYHWLLPLVQWPRYTPLRPSFTNANQFWLVVSLIIAAVMVGVLVLRRWPVVVVALVLALATVGTLLANPASNAFQQAQSTVPPAVKDVRALVDQHDLSVSIDRGCSRPGNFSDSAVNVWSYALLPRHVKWIWTSSIPPKSDIQGFSHITTHIDTDIVLTCQVSPLVQASGGRRIIGTSAFYTEAWVMPGKLQDQLEREGKLKALGDIS